MDRELALAAVSVTLSLVASLATWLAQYTRQRDLRKQQDALTRASFDSAVGTSQLEQLGRLLEKELGSVSIEEYARDLHIRSRFRSIFGNIAEYVGVTEPQGGGVRPGEAAPDREDDGAAQIRRTESGDSEMDRALSDVLDGEVWNGLARARRRLESELLEVARRHAVNVEERKIGAGQLLSLVSRVNAISESTERDLRYALQVANSGIHGSDVEVGQALESILLIDRFLQESGTSRHDQE